MYPALAWLSGWLLLLSSSVAAQSTQGLSPPDLSQIYAEAFDKYANNANELELELKRIYYLAVERKQLDIAGKALYMRGKYLLYNQQHQDYQAWLQVHREFNQTYQLGAGQFFIDKLELSRLFHQMQSIQLRTQAKELLQTIAVEDVLVRSANTYAIHSNDVGDIHNYIGLAEQDLGLYDSALIEFGKALDYYQQAGSEENVAIALGNMALVYAANGDTEAAIDYTKRAIASSRELDKPYGYFQGLANLASYQIIQARSLKNAYGLDSNQAKQAFSRVESTLNQLITEPKLQNYAGVQSDTYYWLATYYYEINQLDKAQQYLATVYKSIQSREDESYLRQVQELEAYILTSLGEYRQALGLFESALAYYMEQQKHDKAMGTLADLSWTHEQLGELTESLNYYKQYVALQNQVYDDKRLALLTVEQERNNAKLREKEIELLEEQNRLVKLQVSYQNQLLLSAVAVALTIILFIWMRLRYKHKLANQYQQLSHFDSLTKIGNRLFFQENIERELAQVLRERETNPNACLAILVLDIDHFKKINDTLGHDCGDKILISFANRLKAELRESDLLARWGGEEFVIAGRVRNQHEVYAFNQRMLAAISCKPFRVDDSNSLNVTCSIGATVFPLLAGDNQPEWVKLVTLADKALYQAKRKGRNGWVVYDNAQFESTQKLDQLMKRPIHEAVANGLLQEVKLR